MTERFLSQLNTELGSPSVAGRAYRELYGLLGCTAASKRWDSKLPRKSYIHSTPRLLISDPELKSLSQLSDDQIRDRLREYRQKSFGKRLFRSEATINTIIYSIRQYNRTP